MKNYRLVLPLMMVATSCAMNQPNENASENSEDSAICVTDSNNMATTNTVESDDLTVSRQSKEPSYEEAKSFFPDLQESHMISVAKGDFNGDGKCEYARFTMSAEDLKKWEVNPESEISPYVEFSDPSIGRISTEHFMVDYMTNLGDLNNDGRDDLGFNTHALSNWTCFNVYGLTKAEGWQKLIDSFTTFAEEEMTNRVEKIDGKRVIVHETECDADLQNVVKEKIVYLKW